MMERSVFITCDARATTRGELAALLRQVIAEVEAGATNGEHHEGEQYYRFAAVDAVDDMLPSAGCDVGVVKIALSELVTTEKEREIQEPK